jgi:hypothetical protein
MRGIWFVMAAALTLTAPLQSASAQQTAFNPAVFDWTDPGNWDRSATASNNQNWTLRDPAARAYHRQALQTGQYCVYSFMYGRRAVNLRVPEISPACQKHT